MDVRQNENCCANVQCTVDKRWMHTKNVALTYNVLMIKDGCTQKIVALKDGCAQKVVALMYNVLIIKDGCAQKKRCANVQCIR